VDSLKLRLRWGGNAKDRNRRCTVEREMPPAWAACRMLRCVLAGNGAPEQGGNLPVLAAAWLARTQLLVESGQAGAR